jgi:hypothetical protein
MCYAGAFSHHLVTRGIRKNIKKIGKYLIEHKKRRQTGANQWEALSEIPIT